MQDALSSTYQARSGIKGDEPSSSARESRGRKSRTDKKIGAETELDAKESEETVIATTIRIVIASKSQCVVEVVIAMLKEEMAKSIQRVHDDGMRFTVKEYVRLLKRLLFVGCGREESGDERLNTNGFQKLDMKKDDDDEDVCLPFLISICVQELSEIASGTSSVFYFIRTTSEESRYASASKSNEQILLSSSTEALHCIEECVFSKDRHTMLRLATLLTMINCLGKLMLSVSFTQEGSGSSKNTSSNNNNNIGSDDEATISSAFMNSISKAIIENTCKSDSLIRSVLRVLSSCMPSQALSSSQNSEYSALNQMYSKVINAIFTGISSCNVHEPSSRLYVCVAVADVADAFEQMSDGKNLKVLLRIIVSMCQNFQIEKASIIELLHVALRLASSCKSDIVSEHLIDLFCLLPSSSHGESTLLLKVINCAFTGKSISKQLSSSACQFLLQLISESAASPPPGGQQYALSILEHLWRAAHAIHVHIGYEPKRQPVCHIWKKTSTLEILPHPHDQHFGWSSVLDVSFQCIGAPPL